MGRTLAEGAEPVGWGTPTADHKGAWTPSQGPQGVLCPGTIHQMYIQAGGRRTGG